MAAPITDERTLAGYLIAPTERRAQANTDDPPLIRWADVEEHAKDPDTGTTLRCDLTLRSTTGPLASVEMKRPEVQNADDPALMADAYRKALSRGLNYFLTCNFARVCVWATAEGARQIRPVLDYQLAKEMSHSRFAQHRRDELAENWMLFLDQFETLLLADQQSETQRRAPLPPQAIDLREAIVEAAGEAAPRLRAAFTVQEHRELALNEFSHQFGVDLALDPLGPAELFIAETDQVAVISAFVVASQLLLYQALATGGDFRLDELELTRTSTDPRRIANDIAAALEHARSRTGDYETVFSTNVLHDLVFIDSTERTDVGHRWGKVLDVIKSSDWTGPANYVPGLYESLLDNAHRHVMGVHYTPNTVAELLAAYAIRGGSDIVMDPASGAGTFLTVAYDRKRNLGSTHDEALGEVYGVEIADFAASLSTLSLSLADPTARRAYPRVFRSDFFDTSPGQRSTLNHPEVGTIEYPQNVAAFIGNPPYIRFELRTPEERQAIYDQLAQRRIRDGIAYPDFTGKADLWAFFVAKSHEYLSTDGRLAFVLPWNILCTSYGEAVLDFLGRYYFVDAIIDSRVERWFAAKQNTLLLLARKAPLPPNPDSERANPALSQGNKVRFVRLKQPLAKLIDQDLPKGKQADDLIEELLQIDSTISDDLRWDVHVVPQLNLVARLSPSDLESEWDGDDHE